MTHVLQGITERPTAENSPAGPEDVFKNTSGFFGWQIGLVESSASPSSDDLHQLE